MITHDQLCARACRWLRGTMGCDPVLGGIATTSEIPDAIGWSVSGSIVVECKTSILDFYSDMSKYTRYQRPGSQWLARGTGRVKKLLQAGYEKVTIPSMGKFRYFMCEPDVIDPQHLEGLPGYGLVHVKGRTCRIIVTASPRLEKDQNIRGEVRLLRFALIHLRENLINKGCSIDLREATKWSCAEDAIKFP